MADRSAIDAVIFDVGWVLVRLNYTALIDFLRGHGTQLSTLAEAVAAIELDAHETGLLAGDGLLKKLAALSPRAGVDLGELERHWVEMVEPVPEMFDLARRLSRRYRVYLLSNVGDLHWRHLTQHYGLLTIGQGALPSFEAGVMKPHPGIYREAERRFQLDPGRTLFIDDLPANVAGARQCGWQAIQHEDYSSTISKLRMFGVEGE